jgi:hypothetical protein
MGLWPMAWPVVSATKMSLEWSTSVNDHEEAVRGARRSMGKRPVVLGAAVALVALAVGAIGPTWGPSSDNDKRRTFTLEALTTT